MKIRPALALTILEAFAKRQVGLTREVFEECFDSVTALLEHANNEVFRLTDDHPEGLEDDVPQE